MDRLPSRSRSTESVCSLKRSNAILHRPQRRSLSGPITEAYGSPVSPTVEATADQLPGLTFSTSPLSFSPSTSPTPPLLDEHSEESLPDCMCPPGRMHFDAVVDLPQYLAVWVKSGLTACEIGQSLHRFVYGQDATLANLVTTMVDAGKPYFEIGSAVLRNLDLRDDDDDGHPIWLDVRDGDTSLTAMPELWRMPPQEVAAFADSIAGLSLNSEREAETETKVKAKTEAETENPPSRRPRVLVCPQPKRVRIVEPGMLIESRRASICGSLG